MMLSEKYAAADLNAIKSYERNEGRTEMVYRLVSEKEITPEKGAMTLEISVEDLKNRMVLLGYEFPEE